MEKKIVYVQLESEDETGGSEFYIVSSGRTELKVDQVELEITSAALKLYRDTLTSSDSDRIATIGHMLNVIDD